jgi:radical SAM protein with 4Fe4S-binding SPASM domain
VSGHTFSVVLLPTSECNARCDYCFEEHDGQRLSLKRLEQLTELLLEHMEERDLGEAEIYWQGGEATILGPRWFRAAQCLMKTAAERRGRRLRHFLQTNLIAYSERWSPVIETMFGGEIGTSMDFPNVHRTLRHGDAHRFTELWVKNLKRVREQGFRVGVIAVLHAASLAAGAERFYSWFVDEVGIENFQVNLPFPGGGAAEIDGIRSLGEKKLSRFLVELMDIWAERGRGHGVRLGPFDALIDHFSGRYAQLPCIWTQNCADQFVAVDARGNVALCDCWVTSYSEHHFGNLFAAGSLTELLRQSSARQAFLQRPERLVAAGHCLSCRYLALCHGGCPVRAFTARGSLNVQDPYCAVYQALFERAEELAARTAKESISGTRSRIP